MFNQDLAWEMVDKYCNLEIGGKKIVCPYFTNHIGRAFMDAMQDGGLDLNTARQVIKNFNERKYPIAWWRGKGTPEQIEQAVKEIAEMEYLQLSKSNPETIREFMLLHGLGVDCSGFVYNTFNVAGVNFELMINKASASTFAPISHSINFKDVRSGDIILIKNKVGKYSHVALILERCGLKIVQSTAMTAPIGIFEDDLGIISTEPEFGFRSEIGTDWLELWREERLEFRRLIQLGG